MHISGIDVEYFVLSCQTGLCSIVKEVPWYADTSPDNYFPRCYILNEDEKDSFIGKYLTPPPPPTGTP